MIYQIQMHFYRYTSYNRSIREKRILEAVFEAETREERDQQFAAWTEDHPLPVMEGRGWLRVLCSEKSSEFISEYDGFNTLQETIPYGKKR